LDTLELRREPRFVVTEPVRVTVIGLIGYPRLDGRASNLSRSGLSLLLPSRIPTGTEVTVELSGAVVSGKVRYSKKARDGVRTGVSIDAVLFREAEGVPEPPEARSPESLWGTLKRLYTAVKHQS
jgi:hypothetical protein